MKLRSEGKERKAGRSMLEKGMIATIVLTLVSSMFFVGTTLSWFSDTASAGGTVIKAGNLEVELMIGSSNAFTTMTSENGSVVNNAIPMTRLDKTSDCWEPGAVFVSDPIYVQNSGDIDLEYRLELLTKPQQLLAAGYNKDEQGLALLDVIEFKIVDAAAVDELQNGIAVQAAGSAANGTSAAESISKIFDENQNAVDLRTADAANRVSTGDDGSQILSLRAENSEKAVAVQAAGGAASASSAFCIVGRMRADAGNAYKGLTLKTPFILVLRSQQAGSEWAENGTVTLCTEEKHTQLKNDAESEKFGNITGIMWKCVENGAHDAYCESCETWLTSVDAAEAHSAIVTAARNNQEISGSVWTVAVGEQTDYYCRVCSERIATKSTTNGVVNWAEYK